MAMENFVVLPIIIWGICGIYATAVCIAIILTTALTYNSKILKNNNKERKKIIQITSKEAPYVLIKRTVDMVRKVDKTLQIIVVTDNPNCEKVKDKYVEYIIVPKNYPGKAKARALNYAKEIKPKILGTEKFDTLYLDGENIPTIDLIKYFLSYNEKKISVGPLIFQKFCSEMAYLCDGIRPATDCLYSLLTYIGFFSWHGENLIVPYEIEKEFKWKDCLAEDLVFVADIYSKYKNIFKYHPYPVITQSPGSIIDLLKQRRRWFLGVLEAIKIIKNIEVRIFLIINVIFWLLGLPSILLIFACLVIGFSGYNFSLPVFYYGFAIEWIYIYIWMVDQ